MDMDKIIEKMESQCDMVFNSPVDNSFKCGYKLCLGDLKELVERESETPPCTGSSVQKQTKIDRLEPTITKESVPASKVEFKANGDMIFIADSMETIYKTTSPTNEQLMDKINEIIDVINEERDNEK